MLELRQLNAGVKSSNAPKDWTPDKRFIVYQYPPIAIISGHQLSQAQPRSYKAEERIKEAFAHKSKGK